MIVLKSKCLSLNAAFLPELNQWEGTGIYTGTDVIQHFMCSRNYFNLLMMLSGNSLK
jgi:hypothetical protein